jgi:hypothetical protein
VRGPAVDELGEDVGEIGLGVDAVNLGGRRTALVDIEELPPLTTGLEGIVAKRLSAPYRLAHRGIGSR